MQRNEVLYAIEDYGQKALRHGRRISGLRVATVLGLGVLLLIAMDRMLLLEAGTRRLLTLLGFGALALWMRADGWFQKLPAGASMWAQILERKDPRWNGDLRMIVGADDDPQLQPVLARVGQRWRMTPPANQLPKRPLQTALACAGAAWLMLLVCFVVSGTFRTGCLRLLPFYSKTWTQIVSVTAPDSVGKGDAVTVEVKAKGVLPGEARLHVQRGPDLPSGATRAAHEEGLYRFRIGRLLDSLRFTVHVGDTRSQKYEIEILTRPQLLSLEATLQPPPHTGQPRTTSAVSGPLRAVQGSTLTVTARFDKPMKEVHWEGSDVTDRLPLTVKDDAYVWSGALQDNRRGVLQHVDKDGLSAVRPIPLSVQVLPDAAPTVTLLSPKRSDIMLTPAGHLTLRARVEDDYSLADIALGVVAGEANAEQKRSVIAQSPPAIANPWEGEHRWVPADPKPEPGETRFLVMRARDRAPDPNVGESTRVRVRFVSAQTMARTLDKKLLGVRRRLDRVSDQLISQIQLVRTRGPKPLKASMSDSLQQAVEQLTSVLQAIDTNHLEEMFEMTLIRESRDVLHKEALPPLQEKTPGADALKKAHTAVEAALQRLAAWEDIAGVQRMLRGIVNDQKNILRDLKTD